jgi:hypothetical protein
MKIFTLAFKMLLFWSSYIPVWVMVFLNEMKSFDVQCMSKVYEMNSVLWTFLIIISILAIVALFSWIALLKFSSKSQSYEIGELSDFNAEVLNFFVTFIIPLTALKISSWPSVTMNALLLLIESAFFIRNNTLYFNILLLLFGFRVYKMRTQNGEEILISRKERDDISGEVRAKQIGTSNIFYV